MSGLVRSKFYLGSLPDFSGNLPDFRGSLPDFSGSLPDFSGNLPGFWGNLTTLHHFLVRYQISRGGEGGQCSS